jgi:hypothetical protein
MIESICGEWNIERGTAGGCHVQSQQWRGNPKFHLHILTAGTHFVRITLTRTSRVGSEGIVNAMVGFYVFLGRRPHLGVPVILHHGEAWRQTAFVPMEQVSTPHGFQLAMVFQQPYLIIPSTWEPNVQGTFRLTVESDARFELLEAPYNWPS